MHALLEKLDTGLIVSCQPVPGGPMDNSACVVGFALAALEAGAVGLRIESLAYVEAVRAVTDAPIIGIIKHDLDDYDVRITPTAAMARNLGTVGSDIVAFDATARPRPESVGDILAAIHAEGALGMADCADLEDAKSALAAGADCIGSTLSGYVGNGPEPTLPDFELIEKMAGLGGFVIAEGRIRSPEQAAKALAVGANAVVVGSAITRTEHIVSWYRDAIDAQGHDARNRARG
ncbi:N-acetylmannosamine-6-phosphate 2-epimerase [Pelagibacterium halotolerans]|uniref:Putative N-acetylmannosamine-6-phosphate 2-epimerase n=1 Tax=Pelagibacterium halotolerans (strain DSM 22347 / JCM 15775 / CGMCC 1.7692 / B2) TaxID=1082931 RepID=G4RG99_PELHB|nr:N-acetylmannosamine-6-phosphate 2-epimerase [Pelagibacterium halotolerans]AEQ53075.1 N-acetylmannosamine-6-phosphate 2-epimerase [Pelagibacterium halotolerans B2]SEA87338.1 N-acylglucosamine-6-phosphate 2-epimerase/N-acetylmannosamine-6-phosphate 2-epimerase / N-acetylmannosamine kinase [Pelagibacterium halotolerans]